MPHYSLNRKDRSTFDAFRKSNLRAANAHPRDQGDVKHSFLPSFVILNSVSRYTTTNLIACTDQRSIFWI